MSAEAEAAAPPVVTESTTGVPAWVAIVGFIVLGTIGHSYLHFREHGSFHATQTVLAFFLIINLLVNFWELGLYFQADTIRDEWLATREKYASDPMARINEIFAMRIPVTELLSFRRWTGIWSGYALFDPGYARRGSFGFNIDVGNGVSTLIPATLFTFGMTYEFMPARILGMIGIATFWQMLYGTIVYFFQFFNAGRHVGHTTKNLIIFVGNSNGLWFIFPTWLIYLSVQMVLTDSYAMFR